MKSNSKRRRSTKKTVACRLEEEYRVALAAEAAQQGVELSDVIHKLIVEGLRDKEMRAKLYELIEGIYFLIRETRRDHGLMAAMLLHAAGKLDKAAAIKWAEEHISAD